MYQTFKEYTQSKTFHHVLIGIGVCIIALCIFHAGVFVGYRKASFSYRFGDNYYRAFEDHSREPREPMRGGFIETNGAVGTIVSVNLPTFVVAGPNAVEKVIVIGDETQIREGTSNATSSDLKVDESVAVFGAPNDHSQLEARLIRIVPSVPTATKKP